LTTDKAQKFKARSSSPHSSFRIAYELSEFKFFKAPYNFGGLIRIDSTAKFFSPTFFSAGRSHYLANTAGTATALSKSKLVSSDYSYE
jgi:hypothetical protein